MRFTVDAFHKKWACFSSKGHEGRRRIKAVYG